MFHLQIQFISNLFFYFCQIEAMFDFLGGCVPFRDVTLMSSKIICRQESMLHSCSIFPFLIFHNLNHLLTSSVFQIDLQNYLPDPAKRSELKKRLYDSGISNVPMPSVKRPIEDQISSTPYSAKMNPNK